MKTFIEWLKTFVEAEETGIDAETGHIYDQDKYNAWQREQRAKLAFHREKRASLPADPRVLLGMIKTELSSILTKNPNVGRNKLIQHVTKKFGIDSNSDMMDRIIQWIDYTIQNRYNLARQITLQQHGEIPKAIPLDQ